MIIVDYYDQVILKWLLTYPCLHMNGFMHCHLGKEKPDQFYVLPILQELALFPDFTICWGEETTWEQGYASTQTCE